MGNIGLGNGMLPDRTKPSPERNFTASAHATTQYIDFEDFILTLQMLNCFEHYKRYIHILN